MRGRYGRIEDPVDRCSVTAFISGIENEGRRSDALALNALMARISGELGRMWGAGIVGFGQYRYADAKARIHSWFLTGFSPRKQSTSVYILPGFSDCAELRARLGRHKTGKSCLYINRLDDIDLGVLETPIEQSVARMRAKHETG